MRSFQWIPSLRDVAFALGCALAGCVAWAQDIVLGQTASFRNPVVGALSREYNAGIELAIARANAAGGIKTRKLRLEMVDDNFDATLTVAAVEELVEKHNIVALVGAMGTQPVMRLAEEKTLEKHQLASIGPMTGLQVALGKPNVFPVRGSYEDEVRAMLTHSANLGRSKVAYLYYEAGVGPHLAKLVHEMARDARVEMTGITGFAITPDPKQQQATVRKALEKIGGQPEAIILLAIGPVHTEAFKAVRERYGRGMPVYSLGQVNTAALLKDVGADEARGMMLTQVMPMPGGVNLAIVRDFDADRKRFSAGQLPSYMFIEGYVAGRIAVEIVRRATLPTRESVLRAAQDAGSLNVGGFLVDYRPDARRSINPIELTMLGRNGTLIR